MATKTKVVLKDWHGQEIGTLETTHDNNPRYDGNIVARDFYGRIVGYYKKQRNVTTDFYGRLVGNGDLTASLVHQAWNELQNNRKNG